MRDALHLITKFANSQISEDDAPPSSHVHAAGSELVFGGAPADCGLRKQLQLPPPPPPHTTTT
jgi:hypothetical protein